MSKRKKAVVKSVKKKSPAAKTSARKTVKLTGDTFLSRKAVIGVVGMGYVGVPLAVEFGNANYRVVGFDVDSKKIARLNSGDDVILDVEPGSVDRLIKAKRFSATADFRKISQCDAIIICVPTPLDEHKEPNLAPVIAATRSIAPHMRKQQVVVLESTTFPGTTREVIMPILEEGGRKVGKDFFLGFSPERVDPGNLVYKTHNTPKIVSGITNQCLGLVEALYTGVIEQLVPVSCPESAEMAKLLENIFRNVNIALVNELMLLSDRMGVDIWEVIEAASSKPFGYMPFFPGPGVGGHCIPIDPFYLSWKAKEFDFFTNFITLSAEVNENIPYYVVNKTVREINKRLGVGVKGLDIVLFGVAFKKDVDDARNSSAEKIMRELADLGANVSYHDPYVKEYEAGGKVYRSISLGSKKASKARVLIIHTDHSDIDYHGLLENYELVIDTRNVSRTHRRYKNVVKI